MSEPMRNVWHEYQQAVIAAEPTKMPDHVAYWQSRTPEERLAALELMRWMEYGQSACTGSLKRTI